MTTVMNKIGATLALGVMGALGVSAHEAKAADKVICVNAEQCGKLTGDRGGAGTGVTDATVSLPIKIYEGTTLVNGQITRDGHSIIPKVYLSGHVGDLSAYDGKIISIPVQGMEGGKRMQVQIDTHRDGDELVVEVPKNFGNAHVSGLGLASGDPRKILRIAGKVCDWGTYVEPPPVVVVSEPVQEVVVQPDPLPETVIVTPPPPVELPPVAAPAPEAGPLVGAPRVVTSDANAGVQGTGSVGVSSMATHYLTTTVVDGKVLRNAGWDGRVVGNLSNNDSVLSASTVYTNGEKFEARLGLGAANIDGNTTDVMGQAQLFYSFIGDVNTMQNGGWQLGVQGGVDPLAGAGDILDTYMVNAGTAPDMATRTLMQQAVATNPLGVGLFGGWANDTFQVSARAAYLNPGINDRMGSSDDVAVMDQYYNAGTNKWTDGMSASVEGAMNGDNWRVLAGYTYDRFNYDKNRDAETCGPCGISFQLTGGPQTNKTAFVGADFSPTGKLDLSARLNRTTVDNAGGAEVTGFVMNGVRADLGGNALPGVDLKGTYGTVEGKYALSDDWSMVAGVSASQWNMQSFGAEYDADGRSFSIGARYEFGQSAAGKKPYFVEGRIGYETMETNGVGFDFKDKEKGATVGIQAGLRW